MKIVSRILKAWLPLAVALTVLCGIVYIVVQQVYRIGANDPQIQMAEDLAARLADNTPASSLVPSGMVDIASSLAPFVIVYDSSGKVAASNAVFHGSVPPLPNGVLDYVRQNGEDRISYQPETGVRSALVITRAGADGGFVLVGRSLREVENRIDQLTLQVGLGLLGGLLVTLVAVALVAWVIKE